VRGQRHYLAFPVGQRLHPRRGDRIRRPGDQRPGVLDSRQIAGLYRALRKGAETLRTSLAPPISTTARWRCAAHT
jgi:hypothetical protein